MYLLDANVVLEVLYKRRRWRESHQFLKLVNRGRIDVAMLHFTLHAIIALLKDPKTAHRFLSEASKWRGLQVVELSPEEEAIALRLAGDVGLDVDDGLHYYYAKKVGIPIVSFDRDFDKVDIERLEPGEIVNKLRP